MNTKFILATLVGLNFYNTLGATEISSDKSDEKSMRIPTAAVIPFTSQILDSGALDGITSALSTNLINSGRFRVLERSQMNVILREQGFQQSGACSGSECAVEVGKILAVDHMIVGVISKVGETYTVSARLVSVETGEIITSTTRNCRAKVDDILIELIPKLSEDLTQSRKTDEERFGKFQKTKLQTVIGKITDVRDGKIYKTTKIGSQIWMGENLQYNSKGSVCYDDKLENCENYGRLYDWETAMKVCPKGWHLPTASEWLQLNAVIETDVGKVLSSKKVSKRATDDYSFSANPVGSMVRATVFSSKVYQNYGYTSFWTSSMLESDRPLISKDDYAQVASFDMNSDTIAMALGAINGRSVREFAINARCVQDN